MATLYVAGMNFDSICGVVDISNSLDWHLYIVCQVPRYEHQGTSCYGVNEIWLSV